MIEREISCRITQELLTSTIERLVNDYIGIEYKITANIIINFFIRTYRRNTSMVYNCETQIT